MVIPMLKVRTGDPYNGKATSLYWEGLQIAPPSNLAAFVVRHGYKFFYLNGIKAEKGNIEGNVSDLKKRYKIDSITSINVFPCFRNG